MYETRHPTANQMRHPSAQQPGRKKPSLRQAIDPSHLALYDQLLGQRPPADLRLSPSPKAHAERKENSTGLPDDLKAGIEHLSGIALDDVQVHFSSSRPAEVQALAYTQGTEIHVGPGQEKHLAHEAWHVVQQKQGRVHPTLQAKGMNLNDDEHLEREADVMGRRANHIEDRVLWRKEEESRRSADGKTGPTNRGEAIQRSARSAPSHSVIQMQREWVGFDAERYKEEEGEFFLSRNDQWEKVSLPLRELISQYFGGTVRAEAPPNSIAQYVGWHIKALVPVQPNENAFLKQGIVGTWDSSLARTGHALGTGAPETRENQYGDGIYVIKPGGGRGPKDYQHMDLSSIVYRVYVMRGVPFDAKSDEGQIVYVNPQQFNMICFVKDSEIPSVRQTMQAQNPPPNMFDKPPFDPNNVDKEGKKNYSMF